MLRGGRGLLPRAAHDDLAPSTRAPTQIILWPVALLPRHARRVAAAGISRLGLERDIGRPATTGRRLVLCSAYTKPSHPTRSEDSSNTSSSSGNGASRSIPNRRATGRSGTGSANTGRSGVSGGKSDRRSAGGGRASSGARRGPGRNAAEVQFGKRVMPIVRRAERDLLPGGKPNTPWRRLSYQLRLAPELPDLLKIVRQHVHKERVWGGHHTALALTRLAAILYPKAVAASIADATSTSVAGGAPPPPAVKADAHALYQILNGVLNKGAVRQLQGFHAARLCVVLAWCHSGTGGHGLQLAEALVRELCRQGGHKLAQVAALDPPLFGRLLRALAQLVPYDERLWVDLQRLTLAALLQAATEHVSAGAGANGNGDGGRDAGQSAQAAAPRRLWGPGLDDDGRPLPDCTVSDLANVAFGFAAAGRALPPVFDAIRDAAMAVEALPPDPESLTSLLWSYARAQLPPGALAPRIVAAFVPLLGAVPPRPLGRLLWTLGALGLRNKAFLAAAGEAIVTRKLVFGSPQELVNVVWAFSQLGVNVGEQAAARQQPQGVASPEGSGRREERAGPSQRDAAGAGPRGRDWLAEPRAPQQQRPARGGATVGRGADDTFGDDAAGPSDAEDAWLWSQPAGQRQANLESGPRPGGVTHVLASGPVRQWPSGQAPGSGGSSNGSGSGAASTQGPEESETLEGAPDAPDAGSLGGGVVEPAAATQHGEPPPPPPRIQPLPLSAVLEAEEAHAAARASRPPPDPSSPLALYRYLAHCFISGRVSNGPLRWTISDSQLSVLAASFARAGYGNKPLFHTMGRLAVRRIATLAPPDLALLLWAHGHARVKHDALTAAAAAYAARRWREFSPRQLADVLWAVQMLTPRATYLQLVESLRRRRMQAEQAGTVPVRLQDLEYAAEMPEAGARESLPFPRSRAQQQQQQGWQQRPLGSGAADPGVHSGCVAVDGVASVKSQKEAKTVPSVVLPLHVPDHLLTDDEYEDWRHAQLEMRAREEEEEHRRREAEAREAQDGNAGNRAGTEGRAQRPAAVRGGSYWSAAASGSEEAGVEVPAVLAGGPAR